MQLDSIAAARAILDGTAPPNLVVRGSLVLQDAASLSALPPGLIVTRRLDLSGCTSLTSLPEGLRAGALVVRRCVQLEALPEGLATSFLDATDCARLATWPSRATIEHGHVVLRNCVALRALPPWLRRVGRLDLSGCLGITSVPEGLEINSFLDVAGSGLRELPRSLARVELRWRGVRIDERIAFHPETITATEVLGEPNAERRRVMLERVGYATFLDVAQPEILDRDVDPGGPRSLLRVTLQNDEPLVCLVVRCPSTARQYVLRVPPAVATCRHAAAWIAGFDNPDDYAPIIET
jgi:hypothetical protein